MDYLQAGQIHPYYANGLMCNMFSRDKSAHLLPSIFDDLTDIAKHGFVTKNNGNLRVFLIGKVCGLENLLILEKSWEDSTFGQVQYAELNVFPGLGIDLKRERNSKVERVSYDSKKIGYSEIEKDTNKVAQILAWWHLNPVITFDVKEEKEADAKVQAICLDTNFVELYNKIISIAKLREL